MLEPQCRYSADFLITMDETVGFIERLGASHVAIEADTYHMALEESSVVAAFVRGIRSIGHVQLAEANRRPPGQASLPWRDILDTLRALEYDGWLSIECLQQPDSATCARQSIQFLRPLLS